jgi:2'-5' RNA ligase
MITAKRGDVVRLFAAIDPPAEEIAMLHSTLEAALHSALGEPEPALHSALGEAEPGLRYVPPDQWHVTTAFYGEVAEAVVPELLERLGRAVARTPPLTLSIRGLGTFPKQNATARVLWAGLAGDLAELSRLADRCVAAGRRSGVAMDDRPFRAHLTLARARRDPVDLREIVAALSSYDGQPWPARSLRLVHSTLGATVRHTTVHEWPLS